MAELRRLISWIEQNDGICVIPHVSPDGDCLGSAAALAITLNRLGKRACVAMVDPVPEMYDFLPGQELIFSPGEIPFEPKALLFADVAALDRAGDKGILTSRVENNWAIIDHHETNPGFAPVSYIDGDSPATGVMVYRLMNEMNVAPDETLAEILYVAISTDTGNYSFPNTTPESLEITAKLMRTGFDLSRVNRAVFRLRTLPRARLLGKALNAMRLYMDGRIAVTYIDQKMFDECEARHEHTEGIVNVLADIKDVEIAMTVESRDGGKSTKFSMRSNSEFDVSAIARRFSGGGHKAAAGMNMNIPVEEAGPMALDAITEALEE